MAEEFKPIMTQEDFDAAIKGRLASQEKSIRAEYSDYETLKANAAKWDQTEAGYKQQVADLTKERDKQVADLTKERDTANLSLSKITYARQYGINLDDADRLRGSTAEEIEQDAKSWADSLRGRRTPQPTGSHDGGDNKSAAAKSEALSALRELRGK